MLRRRKAASYPRVGASHQEERILPAVLLDVPCQKSRRKIPAAKADQEHPWYSKKA